MISYDKCVELLSKSITAGTIPSVKVSMTEKDYEQIKDFEVAQPSVIAQGSRNDSSSAGRSRASERFDQFKNRSVIRGFNNIGARNCQLLVELALSS